MKATHTNYLHPRHLRVETGDKSVGRDGILCVSPSSSDYSKLAKASLPSFMG